MRNKIKLLPESLANQIAAGEVVQRPASVVKELMENALDAGATIISVYIKEAGKNLIQVIDNGCGMSETDARMSFERHATSKIYTPEDLFQIRTMGFRGEALASIAAVAQVHMKTRLHDAETGTSLKIEASSVKEQENERCEPGTSISVKNLFFNVPARRNFLKSNPHEFNYLYDEFVRIALSSPDIAFSLYHDDKEVLILPREKLSQRILHIFGQTFKNQLAYCEENTEYVKIKGYIGKPEIAQKKTGRQFFFANCRFIKHGLLHYAIKEAYAGLIDKEHNPFYVLFFEIDPKHIDINVHPTKTEIKFDDERTMMGVLNAAVKRAITGFNLSEGIDFSQNVIHNAFGSNFDWKPKSNLGGNLGSYQNHSSWKTLYQGLESALDTKTHHMADHTPSGALELRLESRVSSNTQSPSAESKDIGKPDYDASVVFQLHNSFILTQVRSGMLIIHQENAHERILYEKFLQTLEKKYGASQQFLFPLTIELSPTDFSLVQDLEQDIHALGFSFSIFGKNTIVINGVPSEVRSGDEKSLFQGFIEQFKSLKPLSLSVHEGLARSLARKSSVKVGQRLSSTEMLAMIEQLFACKVPGISPFGKATVRILNHEELQSFF